MAPRLLLADDHEIVRKSMGFLLNRRWGYDIGGEAGNGQEAIEKVVELRPDVVVLDLRMPVMGGTEAARQIRRLSPATKIVFLSMHDSETVVELTRLAGADACLSKRCNRRLGRRARLTGSLQQAQRICRNRRVCKNRL